jgi:hypothetical protein
MKTSQSPRTVPAVAALSLLALLAAACGTSARSAAPPTSASALQASGGSGAPSQPDTPGSAVGNPGCFLTEQEMAAILGDPPGPIHSDVGAEVKTSEDHICGFGAVPVGSKFLYYGNSELWCGPDGRNQYSTTGSVRANGTSHDVRVAGPIAFVRAGDCTLSILAGHNMKTGDALPVMPAVARALDAAAGRFHPAT